MDLSKVATDLSSDAPDRTLALIILTGQRDAGHEWSEVEHRLRDLAAALQSGDTLSAQRSLAAAREAVTSLGRATTRAVADADTVGVALDHVESLLLQPSPPYGRAAAAPIEPT